LVLVELCVGLLELVEEYVVLGDKVMLNVPVFEELCDLVTIDVFEFDEVSVNMEVNVVIELDDTDELLEIEGLVDIVYDTDGLGV
jgi:hypothetical protein